MCILACIEGVRKMLCFTCWLHLNKSKCFYETNMNKNWQIWAKRFFLFFIMDTLIYHMVQLLKKSNMSVLIIGLCKDYLQLIASKIKVFTQYICVCCV